VILILLLLFLALFGFGTGSSSSGSGTALVPPPAKVTPMVVAVAGQTASAVAPGKSSGFVLKAAVGDRVSVRYAGRYDVARTVELRSPGCAAVTARGTLAPGTPSWSLPNVVEGSYTLRVRAAHVEGDVDILVLSDTKGTPPC
jgi:nitrous oxidase accessory protein NosD